MVKEIIMRSGIYKITNEVTGKFYIGSSEDVDYRWEVGHKQALNRNQHCNPRLQHSWNFYGGDKFTMIIIETVDPKKELLLEREQHYLDTFKPYIQGIGYNICPKAEGGDNLKHHPRGKEIIQEWKDKYSKLYTGEGNPMFGKKHSKQSIKEQKKKAIGRYTLNWFIERLGKLEGERKFQERRMMLMNRPKSCFINKETIIPSFLGFKHKKDLGEKQRRTKFYFDTRWNEFVSLVKSKKYSQRQLSVMLNIPRPTLKVRIKQINE